MSTDSSRLREGLLATILSEESYRPAEPDSVEDTGLPVSLIESLLCKRLSLVGTSSGRKLAEFVCLPFRVLEPVFQNLRARQLIVHKNSAPLNDYNYALTEQGRDRAKIEMEACGYVGPAPVPMMDYVLATEAQTIRAESPKREQLKKAFSDITIDEDLFESLGPAINSGAGLFLYGDPGNGKSTLAKRITMCFGQDVWIPHVLVEDGQLIKLYDAAFHQVSQRDEASIIKAAAYDRRWLKIKRPTVIVGGELTMESLEIRYDPHSNVSEAPLQLKSNCGCLLIDDFGRQRISEEELLNRWIIPLESGYDFLTLSTGKKIRVPFEQLIIFSTNLEPSDLVDEAFLRRIPYKIEIGDPSVDEFHELFQIYARAFECDFRPDVVDHLIRTLYKANGRPMRRCHPRDLLQQVRNYCVYNDLPMEMRDEYFDLIAKNFFSVVVSRPPKHAAPPVAPAAAPVPESVDGLAASTASLGQTVAQPVAPPRGAVAAGPAIERPAVPQNPQDPQMAANMPSSSERT